MLTAAEDAGGSAGTLLDQAGISVDVAQDPDGEVTLDVMKTFWETAYRETGNPYLAMDAGIRAVHGSYKTIDYLLLAATTPGEGLARFVEHFRLINTWLNFEISEDDAGYHLTLESKIGPVPFPAVEITFTVVTERFRRIIGPDWTPQKVTFLHAPLGDPAYYRGFFRSEVVFSSDRARLTFGKEDWNRPLTSGDKGLFDLLSDHASHLSSMRPNPDDLVAQSQQEIMRALGDGEPDIETIADALAVSTRTLQRRLEERDLTFSKLVDQVREDQARNLVSSGGMSLSEIAFFLGYSDQSALTRAFKRWTGQTPKSFRMAHAG
ncbi:MAG: AraC family transcriptional regulator [Boseongicola sp.]|nr:AraC family transcriptional regulator [Boseongicola sp.]